MQDVKEALERLTPVGAAQPNWGAVLRDARLSRRRPLALRLGAATAVAALAALFVVAPWKGSDRAGVLDRALAGVGTGRVVHVLVRVHPQGTAIDLASGERERLYAEIEQWYEPGVGLRRRVVRSNGSLEPGSLPFLPRVAPQYAEALRAFATGYRNALRDGRADLVGKAVLFGRSVFWIRFRTGFAQTGVEVAVDTSTYRPLFIRETTGRRMKPGSGSRILAIDTTSAAPASLPREPEPNEPPTMFGIERTGRLSPEKASSSLGRSALWLGREHAGLSLAWVGGLEYSQGRVKRWSGIKHRWRGLELVYGAVDKFGFPVRTEPYIRVEEQTEPGGSPGGFVSEGTLVSYGRWGLARKNGLYVYIDAPNEELLLSAAKALLPVSA